LIEFLKSRGKYFRVSDPDGVRRLSRRFGLGEEDVKEILTALGFVLVLKIPIRADWIREEVLPEKKERS
jgi:hypothetical protein